VPVWHEALAPLREEGLVEVVGIASEQHPERAELYSMWKGFDWPILWDPFNLTSASTVPNLILVDEDGIVHATGAGWSELEAFLVAGASVPDEARPDPAGAPGLTGLAGRSPASGSAEALQLQALSDLLLRVPERMDDAIELLEDQSYKRPEDAGLAFRVGVARRIRYDSQLSLAQDFQAAIDHWQRALSLRPNVYVWRRRLQQYGPRMDEPFPFYDWIARAREELQARGLEAPELHVALTPAELAERSAWPPESSQEEPDPEGRILRDEKNWIRVESAAVFDTSKERPVARVHLTLRPAQVPAAHWNNESGPMQFWIGAGGLPEGWKLERRLIELEPELEKETTREVRRVSFELELPPDAEEGVLEGYVLFYVCEDEDGRCLYMRRDFAVEITLP